MAYDAQIQVRKSSNRPLYANLQAPQGGTIAIQSSPQPVFTLYDQTGAIVSGFNAVNASGWTGGSVAAPQIWYILNASTLNPENLTTCVYSGVFTFDGLGSDGLLRTFETDLQVNVLPFVEMLSTYDETMLTSTPLYQLRLAITDADMTQPTFTDKELIYILNSQGGNINLAASVALTQTATVAAYLANTVKIGSFGSGEVDVYKALMERAAYYRKIAIVNPTVSSPDQIFIPNTALQGGLPGSMSPW